MYKYTKYEISKLVRDKFKQSNLSKEEFCKEFNITREMLESILISKTSFDKRILRNASIILNKSIYELVSKEQDSCITIKFKTEETKTTFELANLLFDEIIMQDKIGGIENE